MQKELVENKPPEMVRRVLTDEEILRFQDLAAVRDAWAEFKKTTAEGLVRMAYIVAVAESAGNDVREIVPSYMLSTFRRITDGTMLPEVYLTFRGNLALMNKVARLPLKEQECVVSDKPLEVVVPSGDSKSRYDTKSFSFQDLQPAQQDQLLGGGAGLRTVSQQSAYLADGDRRRRGKLDGPDFDYETKGKALIINVRKPGKISIPLSQILMGISERVR